MKHENIRRIRYSLDMTVYRRMLIAVTIGWALGTVYGAAKFRDYGPELFWIFEAVTAVCLTPVYGIWGWRMWKLFREPEEYFFTQVKLSSPHQRWWRGAMYFTVIIEDEEEGSFAADTNPIFHAYGFEPPLLEDYLNQTVTVGYNRATGMTVVLK